MDPILVVEIVELIPRVSCCSCAGVKGDPQAALSMTGLRSPPVQQEMNREKERASEAANGVHLSTDIPCEPCNAVGQSDSDCSSPNHSISPDAVPVTVSEPKEPSSFPRRNVTATGTVVKQQKNKHVASNRQLPEKPLQGEAFRKDPVSVLPSNVSAFDDDRRASDSSSGPSLSGMAEARVKRQQRAKGRFGAAAQPGTVHRAANAPRNLEGSEQWLPRMLPHCVGPAPQTQWRPGFQTPYFPQPFSSHPPLYPMYFWDHRVFFMPVPPESALHTPPHHAVWVPPQRADFALDRVRRQQTHPGMNKSAMADARRPPTAVGRRAPPVNRRHSSMRLPAARGQSFVAKDTSTAERVDQPTHSSSAPDVPVEAVQMGPGTSVQPTPPEQSNECMEVLAEPVVISDSHRGTGTQPSTLDEVLLTSPSVPEPVSPSMDCDLDEFLLKVCPPLGARAPECGDCITVVSAQASPLCCFQMR